MHTHPNLVLYKCFSIDLKLVGISYPGAFLITNGSCVMMPIMSALQQGGCYPSCRLMLEKQRIFTTAFVDGGFLSATPLICVCLEGFGPIVLSSGLSGSLRLCLSSPFSFPPSFSFCLLPVEPRLQVE